jgi:hypothetical protein
MDDDPCAEVLDGRDRFNAASAIRFSPGNRRAQKTVGGMSGR